jgi:antibiotic biosynthesis monooxygenase (ABM) superfamily enzyme
VCGAYTGPVSETGPGARADGRPRRVPVWVTYTLLRLVLFAVPLVVVYLLGGNIVIAAAAAAIIGVCLSVILLHRQRAEVAARLEARLSTRRASRTEPTDEDVEDAVDGDGQNAKAAASPKP